MRTRAKEKRKKKKEIETQTQGDKNESKIHTSCFFCVVSRRDGAQTKRGGHAHNGKTKRLRHNHKGGTKRSRHTEGGKKENKRQQVCRLLSFFPSYACCTLTYCVTQGSDTLVVSRKRPKGHQQAFCVRSDTLVAVSRERPVNDSNMLVCV